MATPNWLSNLGLEDPSSSEFLHRPDLRQIAAFFLGILFATAVYYFLHSPTLSLITSRLSRRRIANVENGLSDTESKSTSTSIHTRLDPLALVFILNLVYITTAASQFASLLAFSSSKGAVPCTFLVAWASLGAETVRLIGIFKLSFHLRELRPSNWERLALWGALAILAVVMFLTTAVATGVLRQFPQNGSFSLCYIRHFTLGAGTMAAMALVLEFYILCRFVVLILPWMFGADKNARITRDVRIHRAISLIILDGATVYPSLYPTSLLADFAPFAVASLLVLIAFNHNPTPKQSLVSSILQVVPPSLPQSIRIPTPNFSPFLNMNSSVSSLKERSITEMPPEDMSTASARVSHQSRTHRHPFSAVLFTENGFIGADGRPHSLPTGRSGSLTRPSGANDTPPGSFNGNGVQRRVTAYEAFLQQPESRRQQSFLPTIGSSSQNNTEGKRPEKPSRAHLPAIRNPRQILARQTEVADQMIATPRPNRPTHRVVASLGSINSQEIPSCSSPPAPPRAQRPNRQPSLPIMVLAQENNQLLTTRASTPDSAKVFGSDILLRSREDVMRMHGMEDRQDSGDGTQPGINEERLRMASQSTFSLNLPGSSHHSLVTSPGDGQRPRTGESARPMTGESAITRADSLSIVHEGQPSTPWSSASGEVVVSKASLNALKRPTFGEASFERFKSGLSAFTEIAPSSQGPPAGPSSSPPHEQGAREDRQESSGSSLKFGMRKRSGSKTDKPREHSDKGSGT